tara:strand:- start:5367 stop:6863 length:1497 start_codon:yes stop_codon:yes gene_type:complete
MSDHLSLNQRNLSRLPASVARPEYDRSAVTPGIIHIGVGGFHRSHEAYYTDRLLEQSGSTDWGICGVGIREADHKIADVLKRQDYLYTLIVKHPNGECENRVIGSLVDFMLGDKDPAAVTDRMAAETTKIVSLTITEGGYNFDPGTGEFIIDKPEIQHDIASPESPKTTFGFLTEALRKRRASGLPAFTIQSCDNIQHNGDVTRKMLLAFASAQDPDLAEWITENVAFPNAMVDRITPVTTPGDIKTLEEQTGLRDEWPVTCEPFCQWVIEDNFSDSRPSWETVGAQFVDDVTPYETMKIRLLNAGHSVLGLLGSIHGHPTIDSCMADPLFSTYLRRFMDVEVTPILEPVNGINLDDYKDSLIARFGNPYIKDDLARICLQSSSKIPKFLLPTIVENLDRGGSVEFATLAIAAWCYSSDKGTDRLGVKLDIVDDLKAELHAAAAETPHHKTAFPAVQSVFGDLAEREAFTRQYVPMVEDLYNNPDIARLMQSLLFGRV